MAKGKQDIFSEEDLRDPSITIDPQEVTYEIPIEEIERQAVDIARSICKGTADFFFDDAFMKRNPVLKHRLDEEIESLRVLIKMRKADEHTHDILLRSIGTNPSNASLYKALTTTQSTLLSIHTKIDETKENIRKLLTNIQQELFPSGAIDDGGGDEEEDMANTHRGSKSFIEEMREKAGIN